MRSGCFTSAVYASRARTSRRCGICGSGWTRRRRSSRCARRSTSARWPSSARRTPLCSSSSTRRETPQSSRAQSSPRLRTSSLSAASDCSSRRRGRGRRSTTAATGPSDGRPPGALVAAAVILAVVAHAHAPRHRTAQDQAARGRIRTGKHARNPLRYEEEVVPAAAAARAPTASGHVNVMVGLPRPRRSVAGRHPLLPARPQLIGGAVRRSPGVSVSASVRSRNGTVSPGRVAAAAAGSDRAQRSVAVRTRSRCVSDRACLPSLGRAVAAWTQDQRQSRAIVPSGAEAAAGEGHGHQAAAAAVSERRRPRRQSRSRSRSPPPLIRTTETQCTLKILGWVATAAGVGSTTQGQRLPISTQAERVAELLAAGERVDWKMKTKRSREEMKTRERIRPSQGR